MMKLTHPLLVCFFLSCGQSPKALAPPADHSPALHPEGNTVKTRFSPPSGFTRTKSEAGSFADYLQHLPLKPEGTQVYHYDRTEKRNKVHAAVVDMEIGDKNLQQCADAVIRLRGEYLFHAGKKDQIAFHFTNGFLAAFSEWAQGNRMQVQGNNTRWVKKAVPDPSYASFRNYMDLVFTYAGTKSLEKELKPVAEPRDIRIGDVFIQGGSPGHAVIVLDLAENTNGKKVFLLAQSYMPAQDIHILKNPDNPDLSPWYRNDFGNRLRTPEWSFDKENLRRF